MSDSDGRPAEGALEGVPKSTKLALLGLALVAQAIPGLSLVAGGDWHPPGVGAGAFTLAAAVVGAGMVGLVFLTRRRILALRTRTVVGVCTAALLLSLALTLAYRTTLDVRVVQYPFGSDSSGIESELIPFGTSRWVKGGLFRRVQASNVSAPRSPSDVRPSHFVATLKEFGPGYVRPFYGGWAVATAGGLWVSYLAVLSLLTGAFGVAAVRLGQEFGEKEKQEENEKKAPTAAAVPAAASDPAAISVPAEAAWEKRVADLEAELRQVRGQLGDARTAPSRNGHPREPLVVRAEIRTSGWLLLGAAALVLWIGGRENGGRSRDRTPR